MDKAMMALAERAVKAADWYEMDGWLTHTTHVGGHPSCPVGTPIRVDSSFSDCIVEGKFGHITPMPSHYHPDFDALCDQHDRDIESAMARVLPDLSDPATIGCLLALVRKKHGPDAHLVRFGTNVNDGNGSTKPVLWWALAVGMSEPMLVEAPDGNGYFYLAGDTEAEVLVEALEVE